MNNGHTLLVVDDEPDVVQSVQDLLRLDYRVHGSTRPTEALDLMRRHDVHIVMTDQRMPEMSGVEFLRRVRGEHPSAVRLLFTGYADIKAVIDAINQGNVYRYITKPWDPDELQVVIRQAAQQYDLLAERERLLDELQRKNAALQQANSLKEAFIQVASHELRTPLAIMYGLTDLALRTPGLNGPHRDWLDSCKRAGDRLQRLVEQLTKMLAAGRFDRVLDRKPTDLTTLLNQAAQDVAPFVQLRQQAFTLDLATDLGSFNLDAAKIRDSVDHLLFNAIKFTADGGTISLIARRLPDGAAQINVVDSGVGINPAHREHLFEPFFTGFDASRHCSGQYEFGRKGLGLGLTLVKTFVEMHGGKVEFESEVGKGSKFTITL
jgi:signal transduction histidine kinase